MSQPSLFGTPGGGFAVANIDGGSRGNPGLAAYGVRIEREDGSVVELKEAIGVTTNNVAEYRALLAALNWAANHSIDRLRVRSDSLLLVKQMSGLYRVKHPSLQPLWAEANSLMRRVREVQFEHVGRELNTEADRLANEAMDEAVVSAKRP